jgi:hypothetical protein
MPAGNRNGLLGARRPEDLSKIQAIDPQNAAKHGIQNSFLKMKSNRGMVCLAGD